MADVTWFKVLTDIFSDDKIKIIQSMPEGDSLLVMWFKVLAQAGKTNDGGYIYLRKDIPYNAGMLATLLSKPQQIVEVALKVFSQFGMIDIDEKGYIFVTNWEKHQNIEGMDKVRIQTYKRVKEYRERKRKELLQNSEDVTLRNVTDTEDVTHGNAIEVDIDLDLISTTTTTRESVESETVMDVYTKVSGYFSMPPLMSAYIVDLKRKYGVTDTFIREVLYEAGETANGKLNLNFFKHIAERWIKDGVYTRSENQRRKETGRVFPFNQAGTEEVKPKRIIEEPVYKPEVVV